MTQSIEYFAKTTDVSNCHEVFSETLQMMQITGSLLLNEAYLSP